MARRFPRACRAKSRPTPASSRSISAPTRRPLRPRRPGGEGRRRVLELKNVDAGYGSFQALFGISLDVQAGEAVGVIGPNGAGKTTLMRVISGLIRPRSGSITMEGVDVVTTP